MRIDDGNGELPVAGRFVASATIAFHDIAGAIAVIEFPYGTSNGICPAPTPGRLPLLGLSLAADRHGRARRKNRQSIPTHVFLPSDDDEGIDYVATGVVPCAIRLTSTVGVFQAC
jgi:hypothetical protein